MPHFISAEARTTHTPTLTTDLQSLLKAAPVAMITVNQTGRIILANAKAEELFGYPEADLIGCPIEKLLPQTLHAVHVHHRQSFMHAPQTRSMGQYFDLVAQHRDGTRIAVEVGLGVIQTPQETLIQAAIVDITARKQATELLEHHVQTRTHEIERRRRVAATLHDLLKLLNANDALPQVLHYTVTQAQHLFEADATAIFHLTEPEQTLILQANQGLKTPSLAPLALKTRPMEPIVASGDLKSTRQLTPFVKGYRALLVMPLVIKNGLYGQLGLYYRQPRAFSTEEVHLVSTFTHQVALAIENAQLRAQVEQAAVMAERNRLARDLHDSVTQTLFSASVIAEVLPRLWQKNHQEGERRLEELRQLTRDALAEMRTLLLELRPSTLTEVALADLLKQLTEAITGRIRIPITLDIQGQCALRPDIQVALYRIAQEALNNVAKHARATAATISLHCKGQYVMLAIRDNGNGFDLGQVRPNSLGLNIMRERAEKIGAVLTIQSLPEQGTEIAVRWQNNSTH